MFYPGETDTQTFSVPYPVADIRKAIITYRQANKIVLEKAVSEFTEIDEDNSEMTVQLDQDDTLKLIDNAVVKVQVNLYFEDGTRRTSSPEMYQVGEQYHRKVIT